MAGIVHNKQHNKNIKTKLYLKVKRNCHFVIMSSLSIKLANLI